MYDFLSKKEELPEVRGFFSHDFELGLDYSMDCTVKIKAGEAAYTDEFIVDKVLKS